MGIVLLADAKKHLNIGATDTTDDVKLQGFIDAATQPVEKHLGKTVEARSFTEQFDFAAPTNSFLLRRVPVISLTSIVSLDGTQTWDVSPSTMHVDTQSGQVTVLSGPLLTGSVLATQQAGMTAVTPNILLATKIIIQHLWETQRGRYGAVPGGSEEPEYMPGRGFAIPRRAIELLDNTLPGIA